MSVASKTTDMRNHGKEPAGLLAAQFKIADKLVLSKIKEALGLAQRSS